jgi:hypothetical protein
VPLTRKGHPVIQISSLFPKPASGIEPETSSLQVAHLQGKSVKS